MYNDTGICVDFTKEKPCVFRLDVIGDRDVWNPNPEVSYNECLVGVKNPHFSRDNWTHVLINFSGLNTDNGEASLYLNGELKATRNNIDTPFFWLFTI